MTATCNDKEIENDIELVFENTCKEADSIAVTGDQGGLELVLNKNCYVCENAVWN